MKPQQIYVPVEHRTCFKMESYSDLTHEIKLGEECLTPLQAIVMSEEEFIGVLKDYGLFVLLEDNPTVDNFLKQLKEVETHRHKFYVNADWTGYSRCECGAEYKPESTN